MKELPKELTPELLSLVMEEDSVIHELRPKIGYVQRLSCTVGNREEFINIDTLTRLMKEWCLKQGYQVESAINVNGGYANVYFSDSYAVLAEPIYTAETEFEAILKATHWAAKEKGLI